MLVVVTGTGTEIGKTWWSAATLRELRRQGVGVAARKPVQSFDPDAHEPTDAHVLAGATGEDPERVCPPHRWLRVALAPPMAAARLGHAPFTIADLVAETRVEPGVITFIEGAGGLRSPLADDGDTRTLVERLAPDVVVIVAPPDLGVMNSVRLTVESLAPWAGEPLRAASGRRRVVVALNRFVASDPLHAGNRTWLSERDGVTVVTTPVELAALLTRPAATS